MRPDVALTVRNDVAELERLNAFLATFWSENRLPEDLAMDVNLALEEAGLPSAALRVTLEGEDPSWPVADRAAAAVSLSSALGTHRLLLDWIGDHPPEQWPDSERSIGHTSTKPTSS